MLDEATAAVDEVTDMMIQVCCFCVGKVVCGGGSWCVRGCECGCGCGCGCGCESG